jgi:hypothetical protein
MVKILFPSNLLLKSWTVWIIGQCTVKICYELKPVAKFDRAVEDVLYKLVLPWFSGAMWSDFKFLAYGAVAIHIYLVCLVLLKQEDCLKQLKILIWLLFGLAMYTIWIEPWITSVANIFMPFPALSAGLFTIDVIVSGIWFALTYSICAALDREFS